MHSYIAQRLPTFEVSVASLWADEVVQTVRTPAPVQPEKKKPHYSDYSAKQLLRIFLLFWWKGLTMENYIKGLPSPADSPLTRAVGHPAQ
jgi:hypothetical protein